MPSENWLMSLFKRAGKSAKNDQPVEIVVARSDIANVAAPKRGFFARLFGPAFPRIILVARGEEGEKRYYFSVDPTNGFVAALRRAVEEKQVNTAPVAE
jgi:hypothetical protein